MLGIIRKDILFYLGYAALMVLTCGLALIQDGMDRGAVILLGNLQMLVVVGGCALNEMTEDRSNGYLFLRSLPITSRELIGAKFMLILIFSTVGLTFSLSMVGMFPVSVTFSTISRLYLTLCAIGAITLGSLLLTGIYRYGFTRLFRAALFTLPVLVISVPIMLFLVFKGQLVRLDWSQISHGVVLPFMVGGLMPCLLLVYALYRVSVRAYERGEE